MINIEIKKYELKLKHRFTISGSSRNFTPIVLIKINDTSTNQCGYGEASLPPYLGFLQQDVIDFIKSIDLAKIDILDLKKSIKYIDSLHSGMNPAKAALDIALHDLSGKIKGKPIITESNNSEKPIPICHTIGIDEPEKLKIKIKEAEKFKFLKIKLGQNNDKKYIETIRQLTDKPLWIDVNQGWNNLDYALEMLDWLQYQNVELIEQPLPIENLEDMKVLIQNSKIPIIADESVQRVSDLIKYQNYFDGFNIKLMKSAGINEALDMIKTAKSLNKKIMLGCMTETSCAISAAAQLAPMADWVDLDGNLLITNDPFIGIKAENGYLQLSLNPGIGLIESKFEQI